MNYKCKILSAIAAVSLLSNAMPAVAASHARIDQLAYQLQRQIELMHREVDSHFRNTTSYRHMHNDVVRMQQLARHIHDVAHRHGSLEHLRADVEKLDKLYHHVEDLVGNLISTLQVDRAAAVHFSRVMKAIDGTLHSLRDDLAGAGQVAGNQWTHYCYFPKYGCLGCYCPQARSWYYYYAPYRCYLPVAYMQRYSPQDTRINGNPPPSLPSGARPLPSGATPPALAPRNGGTQTPPPQNLQPSITRNPPQPRPGNGFGDGTFRYDGGPANPVPYPREQTNPPQPRN